MTNANRIKVLNLLLALPISCLFYTAYA